MQNPGNWSCPPSTSACVSRRTHRRRRTAPPKNMLSIVYRFNRFHKCFFWLRGQGVVLVVSRVLGCFCWRGLGFWGTLLFLSCACVICYCGVSKASNVNSFCKLTKFETLTKKTQMSVKPTNVLSLYGILMQQTLVSNDFDTSAFVASIWAQEVW